MIENYTIEPLKGYGDFQFGLPIDDVVKSLGQPSNQEEIESAYEDGNHIIVLDYDDFDLSMYFEGDTELKLTNFYTVNENSVLFGMKVFDLNKEEVIELMKQNGYEDFIEDMEDGDCVSYDELNLDFYFDDNKLVEVFWECQRG
ncbi:MAG: hypothetical protein IJK92_06915 [Bacteroidales bacterium]|nr:hypothetical protein [Bacteroidales bacterium]